MHPLRHRPWMTLTALAVGGVALLVVPLPRPSMAQTEGLPTTSVPDPFATTTTTAAPTTTTTAPEDDPNYNPWGTTTTTTSTTAPPAGGGGTGTGGGGTDGGSGGGGTGSGDQSGGTGPTTSGGLVSSQPPSPTNTVSGFPLPPAGPPIQGFGDLHAFDQAFSTYQPSYGSRSTREIVEILQRAGAPEEALPQVLAPFPVAGLASYSDDWGAPRLVPTFHLHQGVDVFAARGTPVIASAPGTVTDVQVATAIGGNTVYLTASDGTYFYYAHLDAQAPGLAKGQTVEPGQVLGTVGTSGNAEGTSPHLHYEIHPQGGPAVPPVPYLDRWLQDATRRARAMTGQDAAGAAQPGSFRLPDATSSALPYLRAAADGQAAPPTPAKDPTGVLVLLGAVIAFFVWRRYRATRQVDQIVSTSSVLLSLSTRGRPNRLIPPPEGHQPAAAPQAAPSPPVTSRSGGSAP